MKIKRTLQPEKYKHYEGNRIYTRPKTELAFAFIDMPGNILDAYFLDYNTVRVVTDVGVYEINDFLRKDQMSLSWISGKHLRNPIREWAMSI